MRILNDVGVCKFSRRNQRKIGAKFGYNFLNLSCESLLHKFSVDVLMIWYDELMCWNVYASTCCHVVDPLNVQGVRWIGVDVLICWCVDVDVDVGFSERSEEQLERSLATIFHAVLKLFIEQIRSYSLITAAKNTLKLRVPSGFCKEKRTFRNSNFLTSGNSKRNCEKQKLYNHCVNIHLHENIRTFFNITDAFNTNACRAFWPWHSSRANFANCVRSKYFFFLLFLIFYSHQHIETSAHQQHYHISKSHWHIISTHQSNTRPMSTWFSKIPRQKWWRNWGFSFDSREKSIDNQNTWN